MQLQRIVGIAVALAGVAILAALGVALYNRAASTVLVDLGIPGAMLTGLAGLTLLFVGGAIALRQGGRRRLR
jgi:hypothetical protein